MRVLVVDDERPARAKIIRLLGADPRFQLIGEASDGLEALERIEQLRPDLVFLDIQMPGICGFEVLEALDGQRAFSVVFSTAHDAHALRAFEESAVDYLLKPYDAERFQQALARAYTEHLGRHFQEREVRLDQLARRLAPEGARALTLKSVDGPWFSSPMEDILRVGVANKHTRIVTRDGEHWVRVSLRELALRLDARFVRVHRGELVNVHAVVRIEQRRHGDAELVLSDGSRCLLSRTHRAGFLARFRR